VDEGDIRAKQDLRISELKQSLPDELRQTEHEFVADGLSHLKQLIAEYEAKSQEELDAAGMRELQDLQQRIDAEGGWSLDKRVETVLTEMSLPSQSRMGDLSGAHGPKPGKPRVFGTYAGLRKLRPRW